MSDPNRWKKQVRNFLALIIGAIVLAFVSVALMVSYYGPPSNFRVTDVLLAPDFLETLTYDSRNPISGKFERFKFDHIEYMHFSKKTAQWEKKALSLDQYEDFFELIDGDQSVKDQSIIPEFTEENPASIAIVVHVEVKNKDVAATKVFQEVQFLSHPDYYRIKLPSELDSNQWIYFTHPGIYQKVEKVLNP